MLKPYPVQVVMTKNCQLVKELSMKRGEDDEGTKRDDERGRRGGDEKTCLAGTSVYKASVEARTVHDFRRQEQMCRQESLLRQEVSNMLSSRSVAFAASPAKYARQHLPSICNQQRARRV